MSTLEKTRLRYTEREHAARRITDCTSVRDRLSAAYRMLDVALDPRGRFGLEVTDIPADVISLLWDTVASARAASTRAAALAERMRGDGMSRDEIWGIPEISSLGFGPGDWDLLEKVS
jgi:hypothetical protein